MILIVERNFFVSDLDGTLLNDQGELSPFTVETIHRLFSDGHVMAFSTARSIASAVRVTSSIRWKYPVMVYNGALTIDLSQEDGTPVVVDSRLLSDDVTHEIIRVGEIHDVSPFLYMIDLAGREVIHFRETTAAGHAWFLNARRGDPRFRRASELSVPGGLEAVLLNFTGHKDQLYPLYEQLLDQLGQHISAVLFPDTYEEDMYYLELCHREANKGDAALRWAEIVGCAPHALTVFGDNYNDEALFKVAGTSVAVGNARPELKEVADYVIASNADDGVARFINDVLGYDQVKYDQAN